MVDYTFSPAPFFDLFGDVSFHFHDVRRYNVVFSHKQTYELHINASCKAKVLGGNYFHVNMETSKGYTCVFVVSCVFLY